MPDDNINLSTGSGGRRKRRWWLEVLLLVVLQLALGLVYLKTVPRLYNDDAWEASLGYCLAYEGRLRHGIIEGWGGMHIRFLQNQVTLPFVCAGFYRLAGFGITTSRLASVFMSMLAVAGIYGVMRRLYDGRTALLTCLAVILHPWFFEISRRVRPEIYYLAFAMVGTWALLRSFERNSRLMSLLAGVLAGLVALSHPTGLVLIGSIMVAILIWMRPPKVWRRLIPALAGFVLCILPYVIYVLVSIRDPQVDFLAQMRGGKSVLASTPVDLLAGEVRRWAHFFQWPKGAPLAVVMIACYLAAWYRSSRPDKAIATVILVFAVVMPFTTVNSTSRYLTSLIPFWCVLLVRTVWRLMEGRRLSIRRLYRLRPAAALAFVGIYLLTGIAGISLMLIRLRSADLATMLDRIAAVVGPDSRVYGEMILWMGQDRFRYGPYPLDQYWNQSMESVRRHKFDYAVRTARTFKSSGGISPPPGQMPPARPGTLDQVCLRYGRKVAEFRDPYFGPVEIYKLNW